MTSQAVSQLAMGLTDTYQEALPKSKALYERAQKIFPSGVTHDSRYMVPFPIYVTRAKGSRKWDEDGREYIDYWVGHGALLLGHNHPVVLKAIHEQLDKGTHYGASHALEIEWGEQVVKMVPSAEKVRFTSSGTEATLMAIRLSRAYTGKHKVIKFEGHFHGWHDNVAVGFQPPYEVPMSPGILGDVVGSVILCPPNDAKTLEKVLKDNNDIACVILEPTGGSYGKIPTDPAFLPELRRLTVQYGTVLIFDEVITGFRCAPGGAQEFYKIKPDMTTMAKILAGGLPGGGVAGKKEILDFIEYRKNDAHWNRHGRMHHPGTYNANPLSASAGVTALRIIESGEDIKKANASARALRDGMNEIIRKRGADWYVHGDFSYFHVVMGLDPAITSDPNFKIYKMDYHDVKGKGTPEMVHKLRQGMILHGVDFQRDGGMTSSAHTEEDVAKTLRAFEETLKALQEEGSI
jgi:glutamate-1-semialdehyde 2,1-aminomutase